MSSQTLKKNLYNFGNISEKINTAILQKRIPERSNNILCLFILIAILFKQKIATIYSSSKQLQNIDLPDLYCIVSPSLSTSKIFYCKRVSNKYASTNI